MDKLVKWTMDYDLSPTYTQAMPELFAILRELVPSNQWEYIELALLQECKKPTE